MRNVVFDEQARIKYDEAFELIAAEKKERPESGRKMEESFCRGVMSLLNMLMGRNLARGENGDIVESYELHVGGEFETASFSFAFMINGSRIFNGGMVLQKGYTDDSGNYQHPRWGLHT